MSRNGGEQSKTVENIGNSRNQQKTDKIDESIQIQIDINENRRKGTKKDAKKSKKAQKIRKNNEKPLKEAKTEHNAKLFKS